MTYQCTYNSYRESIFPSQKIYRVAGVLIPILVLSALFIGWNYYDVMWWIKWYKIVEEHHLTGLLNLYRLCRLPDCKVPYPPLAFLIFVSIYAIALLLPALFRPLILKLFLVLIPGLVIYKIMTKLKGKDIGLIWLISIPFLQILFALQFDVIVACMIFVSVYMFLKDRIDISAVALGLATLVKHIAVILLPFYLLVLKLRGGAKNVYRFLFIYLALTGGIILPFFISTPREFIDHVLLFHSSRAPQDLTFWAIPSIILGNNISSVQHYIDNLWLFFFSICYILLFTLFYSQIKKHGIETSCKLLPIYISILLLLYITMNKIGNLNYMVWFVPTALLALKREHITTLYRLTATIGLVGALTYAFMLYIPPAAVNAPMFIVEDLAYWNARALIAQSINYYIFYIASVLQSVLAYMASFIYTPTDFVSEVPIFRVLYIHRSAIVVASLMSTQILLTILLVTLINWIKEYL
ncbi:MAG: glycosyltransferase 87 family protein [Ignisphaera sp.]